MPLSVSLIISFFCLYFGAFLGRVWIIVLGLVLGIATSLVGHVFYMPHRGELSRHDSKAVLLVAATYGITAVSLACFCVRQLVSFGACVSAFVAAAAAVIFVALFIFELIYVKPMPRLVFDRKRSVGFIALSVVLLAVVLLNLENFNSWIRWDSYDYYYYFENLSYSSLNVFDNLRPANHAAYGCSVVFLIVNGIVGNTKISLLIINILMLVVGTVLFYQIIEKLFTRWNWYGRVALACVYAFSPFLFGLSWSINLEAYLVLGLVLFFWGEIEKLPFVQAFAAILICFSKETGAIILATVMVARLIINFLGKYREKKSVIEKLEPGLSLPVLAVGVLWFYDFLKNSWASSNSDGISTSMPGVNFNGFGFNVFYVRDRLVSLLFINFTWLIILIVIVGFVIGLIRGKKADSDERTYLLFEALAGISASLVPLLFFITYNHVRYAMPTVILLILILPEALDRLLVGCRLRSLLCAVVAACSLLQCYVTVDPMMYLCCGTIDKGEGKIAFADNSVLEGGKTATSISVDSQYNREIMYFDEALDELLKEIKYDDDTCLILSTEYTETSVGQSVGAEYLIGGFGYPHMEKARYVSWNSEVGERYLGYDESEAINIVYASRYWEMYRAVGKYDRCIFISFAFSGESPLEKESMKCFFEYERIAQKTHKGWTVYADLVTEVDVY